jgi:hypothetical protein
VDDLRSLPDHKRVDSLVGHRSLFALTNYLQTKLLFMIAKYVYGVLKPSSGELFSILQGQLHFSMEN